MELSYNKGYGTIKFPLPKQSLLTQRIAKMLVIKKQQLT